MFTWIVEKKAKILSIKNWIFEIENIFDAKDLVIWQSIAHDGACMTLETITDTSWSFFLMEESLKKTNFSQKQPWDFFNIERCLKIWDRLDGHMVSGHIDSVWEVNWLQEIEDGSKIYTIKFAPKFQNLLIEKWSVTVNGVSLTVVETGVDFFTLSLIPLTQKITNLGDVQLWDLVNLEFDMVGKYIQKFNS